MAVVGQGLKCLVVTCQHTEKGFRVTRDPELDSKPASASTKLFLGPLRDMRMLVSGIIMDSSEHVPDLTTPIARFDHHWTTLH